MRPLALLALAACAPEPTAGEVYEAVVTDFEELYGGFATRGIDWQTAADAHRPEPDADDDVLFAALGDLLAETDDGHVSLGAPDRAIFRANRYYRERIDFDDFDIDVVREQVLGDWQSDDREWYTLADLGDGVVYLHLRWTHDNFPILHTALEGGDALVLDLRHNGGGDHTWILEPLGRLTDQSRPMWRARTRNGPSPGDFDEWMTWSLEPSGDYDDRPIVVLIDRFTISAGERAVLALRELPQVTLIGTPTNGAMATAVSRTLPNGWVIQLPIQEIEAADGSVFEGPGIPPDIEVVGDAEALARGEDAVLDAALQVIRGELDAR